LVKLLRELFRTDKILFQAFWCAGSLRRYAIAHRPGVVLVTRKIKYEIVDLIADIS
jgi:hypothetical protein